MRDPYEVLGVGRDATLRDIRHTYRQLAKVAHPDAGGDPREFIRLRDALDEIEEDRRAHPLRRRRDEPAGPPAPWERPPEPGPIAPRGPTVRTPHSPHVRGPDEPDNPGIDSTVEDDELPGHKMADGTWVPGELRRGIRAEAIFNSRGGLAQHAKGDADLIYDAFYDDHEVDGGWRTG